jgi:hypothetical protein
MPATRVLFAGTLYHLTGRQSRLRLLQETFQTKRLLCKELERCGLKVAGEQPNSNPLTPSFIIARNESSRVSFE